MHDNLGNYLLLTMDCDGLIFYIFTNNDIVGYYNRNVINLKVNNFTLLRNTNMDYCVQSDHLPVIRRHGNRTTMLHVSKIFERLKYFHGTAYYNRFTV